MQNLIKSNSVVEFANNLKSLKQRLSVVGTKIVEIKKKSEKVESKPAEKPEVKVAAVVSAEKPAETPEANKPAESTPADTVIT